MKNTEEIHEFDNHFNSLSEKVMLTKVEQKEIFQQLNRHLNTSNPKKIFTFKYYLTSFIALLIFVPVCVYFFNINDLKVPSNHNGATASAEISIPVLEELELSLIKVSSASWNIVNSDGGLVGSVSGISSSEYEERKDKESIFESSELEGFAYPTSFIRQHVKMNNIFQTLYFYMDVNGIYTTPYILLQLHIGQIEEEDAFRIAESLEIDGVR